jgi:hypothetical protein
MKKYIIVYSGLTIAFLSSLFENDFSNYLFSITTFLYVIFLVIDLYKGNLVFTSKIFNNLSDFLLVLLIAIAHFLNNQFNLIAVILFLTCHIVKIFTREKDSSAQSLDSQNNNQQSSKTL